LDTGITVLDQELISYQAQVSVVSNQIGMKFDGIVL